jgi:hypothetical protein
MALAAIWMAEIPFSGGHAGMSFDPFHGEDEAVGGRRADGELERAHAVQDEAGPRLEPGHVEVLGAEEPDLFADGQEHLHVAVRQALFLQDVEDLQDDGDAALAVAAQDGPPVRPDAVLFEDGPDPFARADRVHVGRNEERRQGGIARKARDEVPGLASDRLGSVVRRYDESEGFQVRAELLGDLPLPARKRVDLYQVEERPDHPVVVYNGGGWGSGVGGLQRHGRLASNVSLRLDHFASLVFRHFLIPAVILERGTSEPMKTSSLSPSWAIGSYEKLPAT